MFLTTNQDSLIIKCWNVKKHLYKLFILKITGWRINRRSSLGPSEPCIEESVESDKGMKLYHVVRKSWSCVWFWYNGTSMGINGSKPCCINGSKPTECSQFSLCLVSKNRPVLSMTRTFARVLVYMSSTHISCEVVTATKKWHLSNRQIEEILQCNRSPAFCWK